MTELQSGAPRVVNLSGGLYRSSTPTQIPEISLSDVSGFDIDDNSIVTRRGYTARNSTGFYPGCVKLGYSLSQRVHYMDATGGSFGPTEPSSGQTLHWTCAFMAKEPTANTANTQTLITFVDASDNELIKFQWDIDDKMHFLWRTDSGDSWNDVSDGPLSETIARLGTTHHVYSVAVESNESGGDVTVTLANWDTEVVSTAAGSGVAWAEMPRMIVGCDVNTTYPASDWSNADNYASYMYFGELVLTEASARSNYLPSQVDRCPTANRVAYYPLQKDFEDEWGLSPAFATNGFEAGAGLSTYSVEDSILTDSRSILNVSKSWHINTFDVNAHIYGQTKSLSPRMRNYLNGSVFDNSSYTITMDLLPIKVGATSLTYTILTGTTAGPLVQLSYKDAGQATVTFGHTLNSSSDITPVSADIPMNIPAKMTFQATQTYPSSGQTMTTLSVYHDTMRVALRGTLTANTTAADMGNLRFGQADTTSVSVDAFMSGLVMHNTAEGSTWGDRPQESYSKITAYRMVPVRRRRRSKSFWRQARLYLTTGQIYDKDRVRLKQQAYPAIEQTGEEDTTFSIFDLPSIENVKGMWFTTESTGYDTATLDTPHGVISNVLSTSTTDGADFVLRNNKRPQWVADRNAAGLVGTSDPLYTVFETEPDSLFGYRPVNPNLGKRIMLSRNSQLVDENGTAFSLSDTYNYNSRRTGRMRGFMYGNSYYFHNDDYYLRFNGNEVRNTEIIHPAIQMSTSSYSGGSGLNGTYMYGYTYVDKSGTESYLSPLTSLTVKLGSVRLSLTPKVSTSSYLNTAVNYINVYRNKGGTTSTTDLTRDAATEMQLLKRIPLSVVRGLSGGELFTDSTADNALGGNPPLPDEADPLPPCKYSVMYNDTVLFTGNTRAPNTYYQSEPGTPELMGMPGFDEYLTADGEHNTGVGKIGGGFIIFKETSRKYVRGNIGGESYPYDNGGAMAHDTLVTIDNWVYGLGAKGFFKSNGHDYVDINDRRQDGRVVSSVRTDVESWSAATKRAARAAYHQPTGRYICLVDSKWYIYDTRYQVWMKYEDFQGIPLNYDNLLINGTRGWLWQESSSQYYVGDSTVSHSVTSGSAGRVVVTSTTALPTSDVYGLPVRVGTTAYYATAVSAIGTRYFVDVNSNTDFTNATKMQMGILHNYADTKYWQHRTPNRNKFWMKFLSEHDNRAGGTIRLRYARNQADHNDGYDDFVADTDIEKIQTVPRVRSENMSVRFAVDDGLKHAIRNYTLSYKQGSEL